MNLKPVVLCRDLWKCWNHQLLLSLSLENEDVRCYYMVNLQEISSAACLLPVFHHLLLKRQQVCESAA